MPSKPLVYTLLATLVLVALAAITHYVGELGPRLRPACTRTK